MRLTTVILALASFAAAKKKKDDKVYTSVQKYQNALEMTLPDPMSYPESKRAVWCTHQAFTCRDLCSHDASRNQCNHETLEYRCICGRNNSRPGLEFYTTSMANYICRNLFWECIQAFPDNLPMQYQCEDNIFAKCGKADLASAFLDPEWW